MSCGKYFNALTSLKAAEFKARPAKTWKDCRECWAAKFTCPHCGPCTDGMVMTTKCCLRCGTGLIRGFVERCPPHALKRKGE
jgi:hypothetical protein